MIAATHGILSDPATQRLAECGAGEIVLTNTLSIPPERLLPNLTVLSIGPLVAQAIHEVFKDGSVTSLFDHDMDGEGLDGAGLVGGGADGLEPLDSIISTARP